MSRAPTTFEPPGAAAPASFADAFFFSVQTMGTIGYGAMFGHQHFTRDILWGRRHVDILSEIPDGHMVFDLRKLHDVKPTAQTPEFPYP